MTEVREPGWYWVNDGKGWMPALPIGSNSWMTWRSIGGEYSELHDDQTNGRLIIGPRIEEPKEGV